VGRVDEGEKRRLMSSAAILVAPNRGGESFGLVVAEGMAAGCAVVASGLPAFAAVLGDAGVLCPPGDATAVAEAVGGLLADPVTTRQLGDRAREAARRFDIESVGPQYLEAFGDAIAAGRRTPSR
jgi:phosphatidylinositol alpha-mannosyltransferase